MSDSGFLATAPVRLDRIESTVGPHAFVNPPLLDLRRSPEHVGIALLLSNLTLR
jgi:hypothetical protein